MMGSVAARFLEFQDKYINAFPYEAGQPPENRQKIASAAPNREHSFLRLYQKTKKPI